MIYGPDKLFIFTLVVVSYTAHEYMMSEEQETETENEVSYYEELTRLIDSLIDSPELDSIIPDKHLVSPYKTLPNPARLLYIRLYLRKRRWLKQSTFVYPDIPDPLTSATDLVSSGFLVRLTEDSENMTLSDMLNNMTAKEVKDLCVFFQVKSTGSIRVMQSALLGMCKGQRTLFGGVGGAEKRVKRKSLEKLAGMIKINSGPANVFARMLIASFPQYLFTYEDEDKGNYSGKENLSRILLSNFGFTSKYPKYEISYSVPIFKSTHHLEVFLDACLLESTCISHSQNGKWQDLKEVYTDNISRYQSCIETWSGGSADTIPATAGTGDSARSESGDGNSESGDGDSNLEYLEHFAEEWVLTRVMQHCLSALRRLKEYTSAAALIQTFLKYRPMRHRRGLWWETLALIEDHHLKDRKSAIKIARKGLADLATTDGNRLALEVRLTKLYPKYKPKLCFKPQEVTIDIVAIEGAGSAAQSKKIFLCSEGENTVLGNAEDAALSYYINNKNLKEGFHCEGTLVSTLFAILCWDIIFCDIENVFYNKYQCHPLDFWSAEFFERRKEKFQEHFATLKALSEDSMDDLIAEAWSKHREYGCVGLSWELFTDVNQCQRCVACITPAPLVSVFEVFVKDTRLKRSGLPDLSIWNFEERKFVMVEVKGPGDSLRNNQKVWLSFLDQAGVRAEVCYVKAVSSKKLAL